MPLEPATAAILAHIAEEGAPELYEMAIAESRSMYREMQPNLPEIVVHSVEDLMIDGPDSAIPVRIYRPSAAPAPVHVHFHGGGWVIGDLDTHDRDCREICVGADCIVVAVDYRLAPEHIFPAAPEDCYAALCWASANLDSLCALPGAVSVGGDSAGGNLAAAVALMARDRNGPAIAMQLLIYPVTDATMESGSYRDNADGYLLSRTMMSWFWDHYCPDLALRADPLASPVAAEDLAGLPPALVMTAEFDPLRDEGEAYAERLIAAGVEVEVRRFDGLIHGFFSQAGMIEAAREGVDLAVKALRKAHGNL
ncbi:alpha/beta hydrolase [SAR92 clade bacterium H455]|uniref:Alpha/beta hydrolase n=1 Tax=SAR92 clade bacterium H455 TaxID=2974818 RepID=A0ABY5TLA9_9GAMM|nr:alpha/beta hydrolase [SAR92 clade bacterium H455]